MHIHEWWNNLNTQMQYIPKWIYNACIAMHIHKQKGSLSHTKDIMMFVKKSRDCKNTYTSGRPGKSSFKKYANPINDYALGMHIKYMQ